MKPRPGPPSGSGPGKGFASARNLPDKIYLPVPGMPEEVAREAAYLSRFRARAQAPRLSGIAAEGIYPIWGKGYFGIGWDQPYLWYQEQGINPFTMRSLAGKIIPMWIDDPLGEESRKNPKAQVRTMPSGRRQVLIFRRAAQPGQRRPDGKPASWPGAPGRISRREPRQPWTTPGKKAGQIAKGNVGVRWRHPGLHSRGFLLNGVEEAAEAFGVDPEAIVIGEVGEELRVPS